MKRLPNNNRSVPKHSSKSVACSRSQRGETIIEVMLSILVLGFTLTSVFVIARRSLSTGQAASERSQALAIVESQIERLRYLSEGDVSQPSKNIYQEGATYCVTDDLTIVTSTDGNTDCFGSFPDSNLTLEVSYSEQGPDTISEFDNDTFTITARWTRVSGGGEEVLNLVYRLPKQEAIALTSPLTPPEPPTPSPTCDIFRVDTIGPATYTLNWTITDATSATFSSGGAPASIPPTNGSRDVGPLSAGSSTTYTITVQNGSGSGTCSNIVTIPAAPIPPTCTLNGAPATGGQWRLTYTTTRTVNGRINPGNIAIIPVLSGSVLVTPPAGTTNYVLTLTGQGSTSGSCTATVTVTPPNPCEQTTVTFNLAAYIRDNGLIGDNALGAKTIFDPYYHPLLGQMAPWGQPYTDRRDTTPDLVMPSFTLDPDCDQYELTFTAHCNSDAVGLDGVVRGVPTAWQCGGNIADNRVYEQVNEAARIELHSSFTGNSPRNYSCSGSNKSTRLTYFDTIDNSNYANGGNTTAWSATVPSSALSNGTVRCINFVSICAAVPLPVYIPPNCGGMLSSVYFYDITIRSVP